MNERRKKSVGLRAVDWNDEGNFLILNEETFLSFSLTMNFFKIFTKN